MRNLLVGAGLLALSITGSTQAGAFFWGDAYNDAPYWGYYGPRAYYYGPPVYYGPRVVHRYYYYGPRYRHYRRWWW